MYVTILSTQRSEIGSMASANTSEWRQLRPDGTAKLDNLISKTDICVIVPKAAWPTHIGEYRLGILARDFPKGTIHKLQQKLISSLSSYVIGPIGPMMIVFATLFAGFELKYQF